MTAIDLPPVSEDAFGPWADADPVQTELIPSDSLRRSLEAVLFVASESLSLERLAKLAGVPDLIAVEGALEEIRSAFADRGMVLREIAGGWRFTSSPDARLAVEAYLLPPKTSLSNAAMETLAIVAYLQPTSKGEIEAIRGVSVDGVVATLLERGFLTEAGRRDVPGRPMTYETTPRFLEAFGLRSLEELPPLPADPAERLELALAMGEGDLAGETTGSMPLRIETGTQTEEEATFSTT